MIDLNDWIWKQDKRQRNKHFRCYCSLCGADRGYQEKKAANRKCNICRLQCFATEINQIGRAASLLTTLGSTRTIEQIEATASKLRGRRHTPEARAKMSASAKVRKTRPYKRSIKWRNSMSARMAGRSVSEETKKKISNSLMGVKNRNYGVTSLQTRIKLSCSIRGIDLDNFESFATEGTRNEFYSKMIDIRNKCFIRDKHSCQRCNQVGGSLNAHHIESWKFNEQLRYNVDNLITLCKHCHSSFHGLFGPGVKEANTRDQLNDFFKIKGFSKIYIVAAAHFAGKTTLLNIFKDKITTIEKDGNRIKGLLSANWDKDTILATSHRASWLKEEFKKRGHSVEMIYIKVSQQEIDVNSTKRRGSISDQSKRIARLNAVEKLGRFDFIGNFEECKEYIQKRLDQKDLA